jgi:hypothetical protein
MRILLAAPLLLAGACNVTQDDANNTTSVTFNQEVAANTANDVGNEVQNIAQDIGNEAGNLGDRIENTDVDVNVDTDGKAENKTR